VHDQAGSLLFPIKMSCLQKIVDPSKYTQPGVELASVCWYENSKMYTDETPPGLLISY